MVFIPDYESWFCNVGIVVVVAFAFLLHSCLLIKFWWSRVSKYNKYLDPFIATYMHLAMLHSFVFGLMRFGFLLLFLLLLLLVNFSTHTDRHAAIISNRGNSSNNQNITILIIQQISYQLHLWYPMIPPKDIHVGVPNKNNNKKRG